MDLGREVEVGRAAAVPAGFGLDASVRMPVTLATVPPPGGCGCDPRRVSPEEFAGTIARIREEGNVRRKDKTPESGSPAAENVKEDDMERKNRLREFGR